MSLVKVVSNSNGYLPQLQHSVVNTIEYSPTSSNSLKTFESPGSRSIESLPLEKILSVKQIVEAEEKTQTWSDGSIFSGNFQNGHRHGKGQSKWPNGEVHLDAIFELNWNVCFFTCNYETLSKLLLTAKIKDTRMREQKIYC